MATLLVSVPCAYAANETAPGALKKQTTTETAAPVQGPAPITTTPQPTSGTDATPKVEAQTRTSDKVPVNKGTVKKLAPTTSTPTASAPGTTTSTQVATTRKRSARRATSRSAQRGAGRSAPRSSSRARHGSSAVVRRSASPASEQGIANAADQAGTPGAAAAGRAAVPRSGSRSETKAATGEKADQEVKGFRSISQAADRVVEVIPGAIVLALAGLTALVLLLMVRSWLEERRRRAALERSYGVTVEALATAIEAKDHTTGGHIERVRRLGLLLAGEIVPREAKDPQMAYGFLLHDIGKLAVPDAILRAPGRLSDDEWTQMRRHPDEGVRMLSHVPFLDRALDVVRHHHERWDGGGYPAGLKGEEIPLWARIFAVVDALDAITADRPYRLRASYEAALAEIRAHAGTQFDPNVVEALEALDPALVEPLLEPAQVLDRPPLEELPDPELPPSLVTA